MNDLTIVLALKDRSNFTYRWMEYAEKKFQHYKIIIADGGKGKENETILSNKSNYKKIDYQYYRYPYDSNNIQFFSKLSDAINKVDTEYCLLADNDDFFIKSGIDQSISFLKTNKDYCCCRGLIGQFTINPVKKNIDNVYITQGEISLSHEDPLSRLTKVFSWNHQCLPCFYDVHRTKNIKNIFRFLDEMKTEELSMCELLPNFLDPIYGKIARIDNLFLMRQLNLNESSTTKYITKYGDVLERIINKNYIEDFNKMKKVIYKELLKKMSLSNDDIIKNKIDSVSKLFLLNLIYGKKNNKTKNNFDIKKLVKNFLPNYIKKIITFYLRKRRMSKIYLQYPGILEINNFISNYK